jgi:hypothetical protein
MPYTPHIWQDGSTTTPAGPISAARLTDIENALTSAYTVFNVKDSAYGAVGNGTTDDTAAIQAALNALPNVNNSTKGGVLLFPAGVYRLTSPLTSSVQNVCLLGQEGGVGQWLNVGSIGNSIIMAPPGGRCFDYNLGSASALFCGPTLANLTFTPPYNKLSGAQVLAATMNLQSTAFLPSSGTVIVQDGSFVGVFTYTGKGATTLTGCTTVSESTPGHSYANASDVTISCPYGVKLGRVNNFRILDCNFHGFADPTPTTLLDDAATTLTGSTGLIVDGSVGICQYGIVRDSRFYGCNRAAQEHTTSTRWRDCDIDASLNASNPVVGSIGWNGLKTKTISFVGVNIHGADILMQVNGGNVAVGWSTVGGRHETWKTAAINVIGAGLATIIPGSMNNFQAGAIGTGVALDSQSGQCYVDATGIVSCATRYSDAGTQNTIVDFDRTTRGGVADIVGSGTPLGNVVANVGSTFHRTDGGASTSLYVKESGNGASTGWVAK